MMKVSSLVMLPMMKVQWQSCRRCRYTDDLGDDDAGDVTVDDDDDIAADDNLAMQMSMLLLYLPADTALCCPLSAESFF